MSASALLETVDLEPGDGDSFLVRPRREEPFREAVRRAAAACGTSDDPAFRSAFTSLLVRLGNWFAPRARQVASAYLLIRDDDLLFLVVQSRRRFDPQLADDLSELDLATANDPALRPIRVEMLAFPPSSDASLAPWLARGVVFERHAL